MYVKSSSCVQPRRTAAATRTCTQTAHTPPTAAAHTHHTACACACPHTPTLCVHIHSMHARRCGHWAGFSDFLGQSAQTWQGFGTGTCHGLAPFAASAPPRRMLACLPSSPAFRCHAVLARGRTAAAALRHARSGRPRLVRRHRRSHPPLRPAWASRPWLQAGRQAGWRARRDAAAARDDMPAMGKGPGFRAGFQPCWRYGSHVSAGLGGCR